MVRFSFMIVPLLLASCAMPPRDAGGNTTWEQRGDRPEQYIVVTVRNDPTSIDVRAGSSGRDYGGRGVYGVAPRARTEAKALSDKYSLDYIDAWPIEVLQVHCIVYAVAASANVAELMAQLRRDERVESVQPLQSFSSLAAESTSSSVPYTNLQANLQRMHVLEAHRVTRGAGVRVAVIDTGIDVSHPELKGRVVAQRDLVGRAAAGGNAKPAFAERHGTAIAGIVAAAADPRQGIVGVAPAADVLALRACWPAQIGDARAMCNTFTLAQALSAAIELRADVVNLSLAGPDDPLLSRLIAAGAERGMLYVGALPPNGGAIGFPASAPAVIRADMARLDSHTASDSSPILRAPGIDILTLSPAGKFDLQSGSSLSAASISGGVALLRARHPKLTRALALNALAQSMRSRQQGESSVDLCAALAHVDQKVRCDRE
jgi:hypothetical protein